jgi:PPOX class probable F420-dependent enzyme/deazaflavin-dependent oxidoreductase (nitroreductase family)
VPLPRRLALVNRRITNRLTFPVARRAPGLGVVVHTGRRSGRSYRTPVCAFQTATGYVIALAYGPDSEWPKNVLAAGGCTLLTRGAAAPLTAPRLVHTGRHPSIPAPVSAVLRVLRVRDYLELDREAPGLSALAGQRYLSLTSFRKSGAPVATPVWVAGDGDALVVISDNPAGKVTRIRADPRVELRPCTIRGRIRPGASTVAAVATVVDNPAAVERGRALLRRKYAVQFRAVELPARLRPGPRRGTSVLLRITPT